ncbi:MAG: hypothetical protein ACLTMP_06705, partial [Eggerthella lenta]
ADDRRSLARERLPDPQPVGGAVPHAVAQARVLQRLHPRERRQAPARHRRRPAQPRASAVPGRLAAALLPLRRHRDHRRGAPVPGPRGRPEGELGPQPPRLLPGGGEHGPLEALLRVPGIGVRGANLIVRARRTAVCASRSCASWASLYKRARFFITCSGGYAGQGVDFSREGCARSWPRPSRAATTAAAPTRPLRVR